MGSHRPYLFVHIKEITSDCEKYSEGTKIDSGVGGRLGVGGREG